MGDIKMRKVKVLVLITAMDRGGSRNNGNELFAKYR